MNWFEVDKQGLAKLLERKGKAFALFELVQNAWDTSATRVDVMLKACEGSPYVEVWVVDDDPTGFSKLEHAFTLFAESDKKADATKRGRFNLGEKLVLALCRYAEIQSTTGTIIFNDKGRRRTSIKSKSGSRFYGCMRMTRDELAEVLAALRTLIPPLHCDTFINGERLIFRTPVRSKKAALQTEIADAEGYLRKSMRAASIVLYEVLPGETAHLYELGIPVVELPGGDRWHVDIGQKVPLNIDRDNVTPAYLRGVRVEVLNMTHDLLRADDATASWVRDAAGDERAADSAIERVTALRFGDKRVIADPTDPEGTKLAVAQGYTVITGGALSAGEWENVKRAVAALPAGQVTPSPRPYEEGGRPEKIVPVEEWTADMGLFAERAGFLGRELMGVGVTTRFVREPGVYWRATYGRGGSLAINVSKVGRDWFDRTTRSSLGEQLALLLHEFGHEYSGDHLSDEYHRAICRLGAKLALAAAAPEWKERMGGGLVL